jgi:hypothetical protein
MALVWATGFADIGVAARRKRAANLAARMAVTPL